MSISADIANGLKYKFPGKVIVVAYISGTKANLSLRGKNIKEITLKGIEGIEGARGGVLEMYIEQMRQQHQVISRIYGEVVIIGISTALGPQPRSETECPRQICLI